jgi:hypothetical protein
MLGRVQWVMIIVAVAFLLSVLELIRRRRLKEEYSILWLVAGGVVLILSIARPFLEEIARLLGIFYAPSALFLIAGLIGMVIALHFTMVISRLTDENRALAQRIALLEDAIDRVRKGQGTGASEPAPEKGRA